MLRGNIEECNEFIFYCKGVKQGMFGFGFLVIKYFKLNIINICGISDRIYVNIKNDNTDIICSYRTDFRERKTLILYRPN